MKTAIVTGASGKIGGAIAERLIKDGYFVVGGYNGNFAGAKALAEKYPDLFFPVKADLKSSGGAKALCDYCEKNFGHTDVFVHAAGIDVYKLLTETSEKEWDDLFTVNVKSAFLITKSVLPKMAERGKGRVVFISSVWGEKGASMEAAYSATKGALITLARALAKEYSGTGVTFNCVSPGVIDTPMNSRFTAEELSALTGATPAGRLGKAEEVAELVAFIVSERGDFITGQNLTVDGGFAL